MAKIPMVTRLWARVKKAGPTDCWLWEGSKDKQGYGLIGDENRVLRMAHRVAYEDIKGPLPAGVILRHTCDNPPCCNPDHLLPGTHADNMNDMVSRGRSMRGEKNRLAKLTAADVVAIRADTRRQVEIAAAYGITHGNVSLIKSRRIWRHVP